MAWIDNTSLLQEWDYTKNSNSNPENLADGSHIMAWWKCKNGHEWQASIAHRVIRGDGCPYCSGRYAEKGVNDLATVNSAIAREWHLIRNGVRTPSEILPHSNKKVWWQCSSGHEWEATVTDRTNGRGCPYCVGKRPIIGATDFQSCFPEIAEEWNIEKNALMPYKFTAHSSKKVWWKCGLNHEWQARIKDRVYGTGCPYCAGKK